MKTINYKLAKKLYDAGVVIESECRWCIGGDKCETEWTLIHKDDESASYTDFYPAPNVEEVIEFLPYKINIQLIKEGGWKLYGDESKILCLNLYGKEIFKIEGGTLISVFEKALEYLLDNGYIGNKN